MRRALALSIASFAISCGPPPQVRSFSVQPPLVCPGQTAQVQWDVMGRASLRAERGAHDWDEGEVPSTGSRTVAPAVTTTFTVVALDAKPAGGASRGTKTIQVPQLPDSERAAATTCDATSRRCTGSFTLDDGGGALQVRTLSKPAMVRSGASSPASITVTHGAWQKPVAAEPVAVALPAGGAWTLEVQMGATDALTPPPQLRVQVEFGCP